jgi:hypothetical protein
MKYVFYSELNDLFPDILWTQPTNYSVMGLNQVAYRYWTNYLPKILIGIIRSTLLTKSSQIIPLVELVENSSVHSTELSMKHFNVIL